MKKRHLALSLTMGTCAGRLKAIAVAATRMATQKKTIPWHRQRQVASQPCCFRSIGQRRRSLESLRVIHGPNVVRLGCCWELQRRRGGGGDRSALPPRSTANSHSLESGKLSSKCIRDCEREGAFCSFFWPKLVSLVSLDSDWK